MTNKTLYSEVVKDLKSAKEFCDLNKIKEFAIVVLWYEKEEKEKKEDE